MRLRLFSVGLALFSVVVVVLNLAATKTTFSEQETLQGIHKLVRVSFQDFKKDLTYLHDMGFDVAGVNLDGKTADFVVSGDEFTALTTMLPVNVLNMQELKAAAAPDSQYLDYDKLTTRLKSIQEKYPDLMRVEEIGKTLENRPVWAVKISDHVNVTETDEPVMFFNAMHHAREVMTTEVAVDMIEHLTSGYASDSKITDWVNSTEVWVIPMVNPDGNHKVWHSDNMWRKNTRNGYGVDINRNYPYRWGRCAGASNQTSNDSYRGEGPASEPETQTIMRFVERIKPVFSISYHSYSEMVLYPYGCGGNRVVNRGLIEGLGKKLASVLPSDRGNGVYKAGTPIDLLYPVDGGDIDWMHEIHQVIPYVIELNADTQGFQPSYSGWRNKTVEKARKSWMLLLDRVHQSGIRGFVSKLGTSDALRGAKITAYSAQAPELMAVTYSTGISGTYHIVLDPGTYTLTIESAGQRQEHTVVVGSGLEVLDLSL